ncbi:hypothetical protein ACFQ4C_07565 [Larkinella insperata]|uniref:Uncharacterized protein n=1 Tax=Larkinella insperata TaxID=332158 RepID=A0ABW3QKU6_9BACT
MRKAVIKVSAQSESELYYYEGSIMKKGKEFSIEYPNQLRFLQLETDNRTTEAQLKLLKLDYRAALRAYSQKVLELTELKHKLSREQSRKAVSDYDEGNRREAVMELSKKIEGFVMPVPPDWLRYETEKDMLELRLQNNKRLNASLLIWQALDAKN